MPDKIIKVAIIGGGLAGATIASALDRHTHIDVNIFESAPEFSERGASVGINASAQAALAEIGGAATDVVERAGGVIMSSSRAVMGAGSSATQTIFDLAPQQRGKVVHRASLLTELLRPIEAAKKHTNKKITRIDESNNGELAVHFEDGSMFDADVVIGADGVHGYVRSHILGPDHPATQAYPAGFWDARSLVPIEKARELFGDDITDENRQYGYIGNGGFFMHDKLDDGKMMQFVVSGMISNETLAQGEWSKKLDQATLEKTIESYMDPSLSGPFIKLMLQNPELKAYAQSHHEIDAPAYAKGHVCIMGDAAHCMTPWQGSGAGQAIEDAMILSALLERVHDPRQIAAALIAYDEVRRPRSQRVVHSSAGTGVIMCGSDSVISLDIDKIRELLPVRWAFIYGLNLTAHKQEAFLAFEKFSKE